MKKVVPLILLFLTAALSGYAQKDSLLDSLCYQAYVKGKIELWEKAHQVALEDHSFNMSDSSLYGLLMLEYGYAAYCIAEKENKKASELLSLANERCDTLLSAYPEDPEYIGLKAALLAFEMNVRPFRMPKLGPESIRLTDMAYGLDPDNIMALSCKANQLNFSPRMFGGDPDMAIPLYLKLINRFEEDPGYREDWRYINTMVILAGAYEKKEMFQEACRVYENIIVSDSTINWVNNKLYPDCKKKLGQSK